MTGRTPGNARNPLELRHDDQRIELAKDELDTIILALTSMAENYKLGGDQFKHDTYRVIRLIEKMEWVRAR